ncbi:MAG: coiled-coil domain-containing protein [Promethearchaeota archaeon]
MAERDLKNLDEALFTVSTTRETFSSIFQNLERVLKETKATIQELDGEKRRLTSEKETLAAEKDELVAAKEQLEREKAFLEKEREALERDKQTLKRERDEKDEKLGELTEKQRKLLNEYLALKKDLEELSKIADKKSEAEVSFNKIKTTLRIYITLLDRIYDAMPHFRILYLLHGQQQEVHRDTIKSATGISGAMVLRSLHELARARLVKYDENTGMASLVERFF